MSFASTSQIVCGALRLMLSIGVVYGMPDLGGFRSLPVLATEGGPEFTYRSTDQKSSPYGPSEWHLGYVECAGTRQSPINLSAATEIDAPASDYALQFFPASCSSAELHYEVDDHFYKVDFSSCSEVPSLSFRGVSYDLLQLHFHSASEHLIGSTHHDAEVHLVHLQQGTDDKLLVVGVLIDATEFGDNVQISNLWSVLNLDKSSMADLAFVSSPYDLVPSTPTYAHYIGSLTTPPCTEGVRWVVFTEPTLMRALHLEQYRDHVSRVIHTKVDERGNTCRPEQALNGRIVKFVS